MSYSVAPGNEGGCNNMIPNQLESWLDWKRKLPCLDMEASHGPCAASDSTQVGPNQTLLRHKLLLARRPEYPNRNLPRILEVRSLRDTNHSASSLSITLVLDLDEFEEKKVTFLGA